MQRKTKQQSEQNFQVFNPEDVKKTVEIAVKPKPSIEELTTIEKVGKIKKENKKPKQIKNKIKSNGYTLIITEKPQAAGKIAAALSNGSDVKRTTKVGVSYYELERNGKKILVACAVGHLFSVAQSKKQQGYPVFDIEWKPNFEVRKKDFTKKYYLTLKSLMNQASEIIIATDFDIEGEVIGYNIVRFIAQRDDAKRMKFSSLTAKELQDAYENAHPTIEWGQAIAGETRHFLDWLYGINLSRALMHAIKSTGRFKIMSIGRVQGPTLHMIVEREKQILSFKPEPYWQVFITVNDGKNKLELKYIKDITKKKELDKFKSLEGKKTIVSTSKSKQSLIPPAPFDLTTLQTEIYKFHSITPAQTLQAAQNLYLAGLISYPRTSSQKIPEAMQPKIILKNLEKNFKKLTENATRSKPVEGSKSDPAHPAIIPTGNYNKLEGNEEKVFNLIVKRFISCFCDNAELENKKVEAVVDELRFNTKGMEILNPGWMKVYPAKLQEKEVKDMNGEAAIEKVKIDEKETQPPKRYTPASIVSELEKRNLGTKATRANIIETLYDRNYIQDRSIKATELGIHLINTLEKYSPVIIDENLTREMEKDMEAIRSSKHSLKEKQEKTVDLAKKSLVKISEDFKKKEQNIGKELVSANQALWNAEKENNKLDFKCPNCNEGNLTIKYSPRFKSYFIACTNYPNCRQTYSLPSQSLIKTAGKTCEVCGWPMLIRIKSGKRPWIFCFNPKCPTRLNKDASKNKDVEEESSEEDKNSEENNK